MQAGDKVRVIKKDPTSNLNVGEEAIVAPLRTFIAGEWCQEVIARGGKKYLIDESCLELIPELVRCDKWETCKEPLCTIGRNPHKYDPTVCDGVCHDGHCVPYVKETEPQMMICEGAGKCGQFCTAGHNKPHKEFHACKICCDGAYKCIPYTPALEADMFRDMVPEEKSGPFFCWVQGRGYLSRSQSTFNEAEKEAARLASLPENIGHKVHILGSLGFCAGETKVTWHKV